MSQGLYVHVVKNAGAIVDAPLYNTAHQNHVINDIPTSTGAHSDDVTMMRAMTDPAPATVPTPVLDLGSEIEQLRFVIDDIKVRLNAGGPIAQWYTPVTATASLEAGRGARVYRNGVQTINQKTLTPAILDTVRFDTGISATPFWAAGSPTKISAPVSGIYSLVGFGTWLATAGAGSLALVLRLNGQKALAATEYTLDGVAEPRGLVVSSQFRMTAGSYVELVCFQTSGPTLGIDLPELDVALLAPLGAIP